MNKISKRFKQSKRLQIASILGAVILVLGTIFYILVTANRVQIDNSVVSAPLSSVTPTSPGILKKVSVAEGQTVKKGDVLAVVGSETLTAYSDGLIIETNKGIGGNVGPTVPVIKMINLASMRVDGVIDENKGLSDIKIGQPVTFTIDALPGKKYWGYIDETGATAKQTQAAFSISSERPTQQFDVYAKFDAAAYPEIKNGMSAKMTVYTNTR